MLQNEFEKLTGVTVTPEYYDTEVEPLYMATDIDKIDFCKEWKNLKDSKVVAKLIKVNQNLRTNMEHNGRLVEEIGFAIIDASVMMAPNEEMKECLRELALRYLSDKRYLTYILDSGYLLSEKERGMLINLINN